MAVSQAFCHFLFALFVYPMGAYSIIQETHWTLGSTWLVHSVIQIHSVIHSIMIFIIIISDLDVNKYIIDNGLWDRNEGLTLSEYYNIALILHTKTFQVKEIQTMSVGYFPLPNKEEVGLNAFGWWINKIAANGGGSQINGWRWVISNFFRKNIEYLGE